MKPDWSCEIEGLREIGLLRDINYFESPPGAHVMLGGRRLLMLSSNNYLGLANDPRIKEAVIKAIEKYGVGSSGSRLTTGSYELQRELEDKLARLKGAESCHIFNTGYMANIGTIAAIADRDWVVYCDRLNHASIIDGCRLSKAKFAVYKHNDMNDLEKKMSRFRDRPGLVVTDGVFSMDGDLANLPRIKELADEYDMLSMVDDAHATGVLGGTGAGTAEHFGMKNGVDIQMGTLSKALAGEGGFVSGSEELISILRNRARSFIYSTALSPQAVAVASSALDIMAEEPSRLERLKSNSAWMRKRLSEEGLDVVSGETPIIPVMVGDARSAKEFSNQLLDAGIYISAIRPPTVPKGTSRLRITVTSEHTIEDLEGAVHSISDIARKLGIIE
jgi:8-amino-7-oxononanoate synthase